MAAILRVYSPVMGDYSLSMSLWSSMLGVGVWALKNLFAERGEMIWRPVLDSRVSLATRATSPPSFAHTLFSSNVCGFLAFVMLVAESSASIFNTSSSLVILSRRFSFFSPFSFLYSFAVLPTHAW